MGLDSPAFHVPSLGRTVLTRTWDPRGSSWNCLPLELLLFPRTLSLMFFSHPKTVPFSRAGVGSTSK